MKIFNIHTSDTVCEANLVMILSCGPEGDFDKTPIFRRGGAGAAFDNIRRDRHRRPSDLRSQPKQLFLGELARDLVNQNCRFIGKLECLQLGMISHTSIHDPRLPRFKPETPKSEVSSISLPNTALPNHPNPQTPKPLNPQTPNHVLHHLQISN